MLPQNEHTHITCARYNPSQVERTIRRACDNGQVQMLLRTELYIEKLQSAQTRPKPVVLVTSY